MLDKTYEYIRKNKTHNLIQPVVFDKVELFNELFSKWAEYEVGNHQPKFPGIPFIGAGVNKAREKSKIADYCEICWVGSNRHNWLRVQPSDELVSWIKGNMIPIDYDEIFFSISIYSDETALVRASYNRIIGSRWLALIDARSIPMLGYEWAKIDEMNVEMNAEEN